MKENIQNYKFKFYTGLYSGTALTLVKRLLKSRGAYCDTLETFADNRGEVIIGSISEMLYHYTYSKSIAYTPEYVVNEFKRIIKDNFIVDLPDPNRAFTVARYITGLENEMDETEKKTLAKLKGKPRDDVKAEVAECVNTEIEKIAGEYEAFRAQLRQHNRFPSMAGLFGVYNTSGIVRCDPKFFNRPPSFVPDTELDAFMKLEAEMIEANNTASAALAAYGRKQREFKIMLDNMMKRSTAVRNEKDKAVRKEFKI